MRKIFLFLFAAVLSIGTAMAQTEVYLTGATVTLDGQNLVVQAQWGERPITISLWQQNIQGTGYYAADDIYCTVLNPWGEWTATTDENSYQEMGGSFSFSGYFTDGAEIYDVWIQGSTASSTPETGVMEATEVAVTIEDGTWFAEAYADDYSWSLNLEVADYNGFDNYEVVADYNGTLVFGIGEIFFDEYNGKICFETGVDGLQSEDGSVVIYPMLYIQTISVMSSNTFPAEASYWEEHGKTGYTMLNLMSDVWNWSLELHIPNFTGAGEYSLVHETYVEQVWDSYLGELVDETVNLYSKLDDFAPLMGDIVVYEDEGLLSYECYLYTVGMNGQMGTMFNATVFETNAETFDIEADNATVAEGNYYPLEFTCTWNDGDMDHSVKVEVVEVKYGQEVPANFIFDGGMMNDGDQAEGVVIVTKNGNTATVVGVFEGMKGGDIYNVTLSGTVPANILETIVLVDGEDNSTLLAKYNGQKVNVQVENRSLVADEYNTLVVPFDMPASEIGVAYELTGVVSNSAEELEVNFTEVTTILAGKPYIVIPNKGFYGFGVEGVVIKNVAASTITKSCKTATVAMQGVMNTIAGETTDGLYWIGEEGYLYNDEADLLGMRAYFNITTQSGIAPRMRVVTKENEATGVENITTGAAAVKTIENGQLIIIRDNVKYNLQGQIVK